MAITLEQEQLIPAISLNKIHILSWLQTEQVEKPYKITLEAKLILYGHDSDGNRVYDPTGPKHLAVPDFRSQMETLLLSYEPAQQGQILQLHEAYIKSLGFMIQMSLPELGNVNA